MIIQHINLFVHRPWLDYATKATLATAAKTAMRGSLNAAKRAVPHLIARKVVSAIADAAKKRKRVDIYVKHRQESFRGYSWY